MIELYHWEPVSHSLRVLIGLNEAGVDFKSHYVDLLEFEQFSDEFLAMNRTGQVPVLVHDGNVMFESALINEYLADAFPDAGLAPTDPLGWYQVQTWSKYIDYNLSSSLATLGCRQYLAPFLGNRDTDQLLARIESIPVVQRRPGWRAAAQNDFTDGAIANSDRKVRLVLDRMTEILEGSEWLVGDNYSIADINTFAMFHGLRDVARDLAGPGVAPNIDAWFERIAGREPVQRALSTNQNFETGTIYAPGPEHSRWG